MDGECMQGIDDRLDRMIAIARDYNLSLDSVVAIMGRCDQRTFEALSANPSRLPIYKKSSVSP